MVYFLLFRIYRADCEVLSVRFQLPLLVLLFYIGITIVRLIIELIHKSPLDVLIYSAAILLLVITLWLCNSKRLKRVGKDAPMARRAGQEDYSVAVCCVFLRFRFPEGFQLLQEFYLWFPGQIPQHQPVLPERPYNRKSSRRNRCGNGPPAAFAEWEGPGPK